MLLSVACLLLLSFGGSRAGDNDGIQKCRCNTKLIYVGGEVAAHPGNALRVNAYVFSSLDVPEPGKIIRVNMWPTNAGFGYLVIWRPIPNQTTYQSVAAFKITASVTNQEVEYSVPASEQISVETGDILGFQARLNGTYGHLELSCRRLNSGSANAAWVRNVHSPNLGATFDPKVRNNIDVEVGMKAVIKVVKMPDVNVYHPLLARPANM